MASDLTDDELRDRALVILNEHLGPRQTIRFLSWLRNKPRDYQTWRDAHFRNLTVDDLIEAMREVDRKHLAGQSKSDSS
jgi:hypothetical protein